MQSRLAPMRKLSAPGVLSSFAGQSHSTGRLLPWVDGCFAMTHQDVAGTRAAVECTRAEGASGQGKWRGKVVVGPSKDVQGGS